MRFGTFRILLKRIKAIKQYLLDPKASKLKKLLIIFGIIYLLSPIDLIPEPVLGFGFIDDIALWAFILLSLRDELDTYWNKNEFSGISAAAKRKYKGKRIIEVEAVEITDEQSDKDAENSA